MFTQDLLHELQFQPSFVATVMIEGFTVEYVSQSNSFSIKDEKGTAIARSTSSNPIISVKEAAALIIGYIGGRNAAVQPA